MGLFAWSGTFMSGNTSEKDAVIDPVILPDGYQPSQDEEFEPESARIFPAETDALAH